MLNVFNDTECPYIQLNSTFESMVRILFVEKRLMYDGFNPYSASHAS